MVDNEERGGGHPSGEGPTATSGGKFNVIALRERGKSTNIARPPSKKRKEKPLGMEKRRQSGEVFLAHARERRGRTHPRNAGNKKKEKRNVNWEKPDSRGREGGLPRTGTKTKMRREENFN